MDTIQLLLILITGLFAGGVAGWFFAKSKFDHSMPFSLEEYNVLKNDKTVAEQRLLDVRSELDEKKKALDTRHDQLTALSNELTREVVNNSGLQEKLEKQKSELEDLHKKIKEQFENIANKILFDNSRMIQQQHSDKLTDILNPLKEKIEKFENTVNVTHKESIRENQSLKEQLRLLQDLNKSIGEEAKNLTTALKGQVKTQGNWGEMILETILQRSGLVKDREYFVQYSLVSEEGKRLQPDVLIRLPDNKTIIVDSKVSLLAYERYSSATTDVERELALKEHIVSLRRHIKGLGEKKYQQLYEIKTLDFVLLFIPIEPAFSTAVMHDSELFNDAFDSNIVIVSTSTLLATLRTIASIWKLEYQNANALEIARQGGALYDKFAGFVTDMDKIGEHIDRSHRVWEDAKKKLSTGSGNLVRSVEKLKKLGANASRSMPAILLNDASEEDDAINPAGDTEKL
ncbi:MAG: DNA recombination protein RmuC [Burkholderiaceae bacterium]|nr:DNA recombination protein RmuC [Burkholderiaceae bacterium]